MSDIWNDPPPVHYDDGERFGTSSEMIAEIRRLRAERSPMTQEEAQQKANWLLEQIHSISALDYPIDDNGLIAAALIEASRCQPNREQQ